MDLLKQILYEESEIIKEEIPYFGSLLNKANIVKCPICGNHYSDPRNKGKHEASKYHKFIAAKLEEIKKRQISTS